MKRKTNRPDDNRFERGVGREIIANYKKLKCSSRKASRDTKKENEDPETYSFIIQNMTMLFRKFKRNACRSFCEARREFLTVKRKTSGKF